MSERADVRIPSHGEELAAYLYRPDGAAGDVPCVVMAHGFSATRDDALPGYAEAFRDAGLAALVFDYRHFGASTGEPRQLLDVAKQHADYRAAISFARALDGVDADRIVLWGSSFSGGHVICVAAGDPRICAVVAQAPFVDSLPTMALVPPLTALRTVGAALVDGVGALLGRPAHTMPAVADPGGFAVMTSPDARPGMEAIVPAGSLWRNEFAARLMLTFLLYRPIAKAPRLQMPLLVCVCDEDRTTPPGPAVKAAERAPRGELVHYPYAHFDIYADPQAKVDQVAFVQRVTGGVPASVA